MYSKVKNIDNKNIKKGVGELLKQKEHQRFQRSLQ